MKEANTMKRIFKNIIVLLGTMLSLSACSNKVVFYYNEETPISKRDRIAYSGFQRLDSHAKLIYEDGFKNVYATYEEAMSYKSVLEAHMEEVTDQNSGQTFVNYRETVSFFNSLTPEMFDNDVLFITDSWDEASYNQDSCRLEGVYLKNDILYIHVYCDYKDKSINAFWVNQCYTFFINKKISFSSYRIKTTDLFKY